MPNWNVPIGGLEDWAKQEKTKSYNKKNKVNGERDASGNPFDTAEAHNTFGDIAQGGADFLTWLSGSPGSINLYDPNAAAFNVNGYTSDGLKQQANLANNREGAGGDMRGVQQDLIKQLQGQASGQGPSIAELQFKQAADQNMADNMRAAGSARGPQQGAQVKAANMASAQGRSENANAAAQMRMKEQMQAQGLLAQTASQSRTQDLQNQQQNDELVKFYTQSGLSLEQSQQQAKQALEELRAKQQLEVEKLKMQASQQDSNFLGSIMNTIGSL